MKKNFTQVPSKSLTIFANSKKNGGFAYASSIMPVELYPKACQTGFEIAGMDRSYHDSLCCGGGGNIFADILGSGKETPAGSKIREAHETGATTLAEQWPAQPVL